MEKIPIGFQKCNVCLHQMRSSCLQINYNTQKNRNKRESFSQRKTYERYIFLNDINFESLLDVGCAEGDFAFFVKSNRMLKRVDGLEISDDKRLASEILDNVYDTDLDYVIQNLFKYELISFFHVLEHIYDINDFIKKCITISSKYIYIEVPCMMGNTLIKQDLNPEHLHFFSCSSLLLLMETNNWRILKLETGGFESSRYNDCIRILASKKENTLSLKEKILSICGEKFIVYGLGGDFNSIINPYKEIKEHIKFFTDKDEHKGVGNPKFISINQLSKLEEKILVSSIQYYPEIRRELLVMGIHAERIVSLDEIL